MTDSRLTDKSNLVDGSHSEFILSILNEVRDSGGQLHYGTTVDLYLCRKRMTLENNVQAPKGTEKGKEQGRWETRNEVGWETGK